MAFATVIMGISDQIVTFMLAAQCNVMAMVSVKKMVHASVMTAGQVQTVVYLCWFQAV
jgi:hypothetical protein